MIVTERIGRKFDQILSLEQQVREGMALSQMGHDSVTRQRATDSLPELRGELYLLLDSLTVEESTEFGLYRSR